MRPRPTAQQGFTRIESSSSLWETGAIKNAEGCREDNDGGAFADGKKLADPKSERADGGMKEDWPDDDAPEFGNP